MKDWSREIGAVFRKELLSEMRSKSGLLTSALFSIVTVVAIAFCTIQTKLEPSVAAGLFWVTLLFSSIIALPRAFTLEEELGTGDLLRLIARPHAIFWGKALFNLALLSLTAVLLATLFLLLTRIKVAEPSLFLVSLAGSCLALAGGVTLSGALVAQAANRSALAGAVALPILIPLIALGAAALRVAFGDLGILAATKAAWGMVGYGIASMAIGPYLFAAVWKR